jgi:translation initiation factor IF-2
VEPAACVDPGSADTGRTPTQDAKVLGVSASAAPCTPRRRRAAPPGAERARGTWRPSPGGGGEVGPGPGVASLRPRRRSGRGGACHDGQARAEGAGLARCRAAPLPSGPAMPLAYATPRAHPGPAAAGAARRLGGADRRRRGPATARGRGLPPPVGRRARRGPVASARPCAAPGGGPGGPGTGHVRRGGRARRGVDAGGTPPSPSRPGAGGGGAQRPGTRPGPGPGGGGPGATLAGAAAARGRRAPASAGGHGDQPAAAPAGHRARAGGGSGRATSPNARRA